MFRKLWRETLILSCIFAVFCSLTGQTALGQSVPATVPSTAPAASEKIYAIVVSETTYADPKWREVVDVLQKKHDGKVIQYTSDIREARMALSALLPDYICFVARHDEITRPLTPKIHHMTRKLDDDPYTDAIWSILTGYDVADALRIAKYSEPLVLRRVITGTTGIGLKTFESGLRFAESEKGKMWTKTPDGKITEGKCEPDAVKIMVEGLNNTQPQCFFTSGHATENDWQIGYKFKGGQFRCKDGQLYGVDTKGKHYNINSDNPKVYLAVGNCLIGLIPKRDCMALAWMHTGGAYQMFAHVAAQWYGHMGWGMRYLLVNQPGRFNAVEAFYFNQQSLMHRLLTEYPKIANVVVEDYNVRKTPHLMSSLAIRHGLLKKNKDGKVGVERDALGLLWERDTITFYGDPAWDARLKPQPLPWDQKFTVKDGVYTFTVTTNEDGKWPPRSITALLPQRVENIEIIEGADLKPVVTDNFILLPFKGEFKKGEKFQVVFKAKPLTWPKTKILAEMKKIKQAVALVDASQRSDVQIALAKAGENRDQLIAALREVPEKHRKAMAFLLANMPDRDLKNLGKKLLLDNVKYAFLAREKAPWAKQIPESLFYNYILPYANFNEQRDNWRKDFYDRFSAIAWKCKTAGEAAQLLNREVFKILDVKYHATKRPKPHQSPYESIKSKYASCTGLSVLLVDACRAVGIPARIVGIPQWKDRKGDKQGNHASNHSWSEIWDRQWYHLGSAEPKGLNKAWFTKKCYTATDHRIWTHRIHAASFKKTGRSFPLVWDMSLQWVPARDVTRFYSTPRKVEVKFTCRGKKEVTVWLDDEIIATASGTSAVELPLAGGLSYVVEIRTEDGKTQHLKMQVPDGKPAARTKPAKKQKPPVKKTKKKSVSGKSKKSATEKKVTP